MRFVPLLCLIAAALAVGGCATPEQKKAKLAIKEQQLLERENSRVIEARRMRVLDYGDAGSQRGAELLVADPGKTFDPNRSGIGTIRKYNTTGAYTKDFGGYDKNARTGNFLTRAFGGGKTNSAAEKKFASGEAYVKGKYTIPEGKLDATKTAATKNLWDGNKVAETNALHDGKRPYLGREQAKLGTAVDPKTLADWRTGETLIYNGTGADRASTFKQLTIGDIRDLLNKNK